MVRDVNAFDRALKLRAAVLSFPGAVLGFIGGAAAGGVFGALLGGVLGAAAVFGFTMLVVGGAGRGAATLHNPSGDSTPHRPEHSLAESLVARGRYEEAAEAFEAAIAEDASDVAAYVKLARLYRDHLRRPEDAVRWLRRAVREGSPTPAVELRARREIVEIRLRPGGDEARAAPDLAWIAETFPDSPEGEWAARELRRVKEGLAGDCGA